MPKIHIIDDQKSIINIIGLTLQSYIPKCEIITSQDGYEGIELAKKELPDIILLDIMMPRMDGYKACEFLKSYEETKSIPIILMTAIKTKPSDMVKSLDIGADSFLTKPINVGELVAKVKILLKIGRVEKELREKSDKLDKIVKRKTHELKESEKKYHALIEHLGEGVAIVDWDEIFTFSNPASDRIFGVKKEKLVGKNLVNFVDDENFKILKQQTKERSKNRISNYELLITRPDGKKRNIMITATPMHDMNGNVTGSLGIFRDITEWQKAENILKEKEQELNVIAEFSLDTIFSISKSGEILYISKSGKDLFGIEPEKIIGTSFTKYVPKGEIKNYWNSLKNVFLSKKIHGFQTLIVNRKGDLVPVEITGQIVKKNGKLTGQGTIRDITVRKRAEEQIKKDLEEKEILLKEVHHRAKNNMQIISSMMNLQYRVLEDPKLKGFLKDTQNRIRTMSVIHELLYSSNNLANIRLKKYICILTNHLSSSMSLDPPKIKIKINMKNILLNVNLAIPCGLIINELVNNSLKHAFPNDRAGIITISMQKETNLRSSDQKEIYYHLIVSDNGIGFPKDIDLENDNFIGLFLVKVLTKQLKGNIKLRNNNGVSVEITFKQREMKT
ncbi:MAG: PAS domain S-box protein, partial [Candidatus Cloacimonetes bacterium]|nr:PAS domain S-box protein [Candidatus Cloacimonadota bacterium]